MKIQRQKEMVEAFHFDMKTGEEVVGTDIKVGINPIDMSSEEEFPHETSSVLSLHVLFNIGYEEFVINGAVSQVVMTEDRLVEKVEDITEEEVRELMAPLFSMIKRLTYEVTEIAFDQPGITLNFDGNLESAN